MTSHRGGRWAFDERYARLLLKHGYTVDCSVTPGISWSSNAGAPGGKGGPDYTDFPAHAYFIDLDDISRPGSSALLEIPMTIGRSRLHRRLPGCYQWKIIGPIAHRLSEPIHWFRPLGPRPEIMREMIVAAATRSAPYLEFMQHSSEFMPGGSPYFPDVPSVERLFENLEALFGLVASHFSGATLREYRASFSPTTSEGGSS